MMSKERIEVLLDDLQAKYLTAYKKNKKFETEPETWGQIEILEWVLNYEEESNDKNTWTN